MADGDDAPFIVSLGLDADSFAWLDGLRRAHFPPERNVLRAHLTLFHKLPGGEEARILDDLGAVAAAYPPFEVTYDEPMFLGRGTAIRVAAEPLATLRADLAARWRAWLTPQDRQGFRPHVTIQNKVAPDAARALHDRLRDGWTPRTGTARSLRLWRYRGGPWEHAADVGLTGLTG